MALLYLSIWLYTYKLWRLLQLNHPSPAQLLQNPFTRQTTSHLPILHFPPQLSNFPHLYKSQSPMSVSQPRWSLFSLTRHPPQAVPWLAWPSQPGSIIFGEGIYSQYPIWGDGMCRPLRILFGEEVVFLSSCFYQRLSFSSTVVLYIYASLITLEKINSADSHFFSADQTPYPIALICKHWQQTP